MMDLQKRKVKVYSTEIRKKDGYKMGFDIRGGFQIC